MDKTELIKVLYRNDFNRFVRFSFREAHPGDLVENWHIDVMADALAGCLEGRTKRLIINVPPRSLKSFCASIALPVWALGRDPTLKVMSIAGSRELAADLADATIELLKTPRTRALFPHLRIKIDPGAFRSVYGGQRLAGVVGRPIMGRGADIIVVDDPLSPVKVKDRAALNGVNSWFDAEVVQRLNDKANGIVIVVMQRLHPDDLTGHLLAGDEPWIVISLPAIAVDAEEWRLADGTVFRRARGEALCPALETREQLRERLLQVGASNFAAQYQQAPYIPESDDEMRGGCFTNLRKGPNQPVGMFFGRIPDVDILLHDIFGEGEYPWSNKVRSGWTDEEFADFLKAQDEIMGRRGGKDLDPV